MTVTYTYMDSNNLNTTDTNQVLQSLGIPTIDLAQYGIKTDSPTKNQDNAIAPYTYKAPGGSTNPDPGMPSSVPGGSDLLKQLGIGQPLASSNSNLAAALGTANLGSLGLGDIGVGSGIG